MGTQEMTGPRPRVVVDTNVFVSAILFPGEINRLVDLWQKGEFVFLISREVLAEYLKVLSYPKFALTRAEIRQIIEKKLIPYVQIVEVKTEIEVIEKDLSDNKFLGLALDGKAQYLVSGDQHLLAVGEFHNIKITLPGNFLKLF